MKCPILLAGNNAQSDPAQLGHENCLKEECAWWHTFLDDKGNTHTACVLIHIADKKEVEL